MNEISTSAVQYYRRSWKAPVWGLALMGIAGFIGIPLLAVVYAFLIKFIPFLIVSLALMCGYPIACGFLIGQAAKLGKVRNVTLIAGAGVFFGLLAEYTGWVIWIAIFLKEPKLLWEFFFPLDIAYLISMIAEVGVWSLSGSVPTGGLLYLCWLVEALAVVGGTAFITHLVNADTPFCEESDAWAEKVSTIAVFAPIQSPLKFKKELEQMGYSTFNQFAPAQMGKMFTVIQLYECDECKNFFLLNIKNLTIKLNEKGEKQNEYTAIISNLLVTSAVVAMIRSLMVKYNT